MSATLYSGPAKLFFNSKGLFPEGQDGPLSIGVPQEYDTLASGPTGAVDFTTADVLVPIDFQPFDNWGLLATLFPSYVTTPVIGTIVGAQGSDVAAKAFTPDGRLYTVKSACVTKHPELHLGAGRPLYGATTITGFLATAGAVGTAASFYTLATAQSDPGGAFTLADVVRERWTGVWGTAAGWGGDSGGTPVEAEDEFVITNKIVWKPLKVQKLTRAYQLVSVQFMLKFRPYGPTQAQIDAALAIQASPGALGGRVGANGADFTLTSAISAKTITLKNARPVSAAYDFGGNKLGNGEVLFLCGNTFTAGAANAVIVFSA